MKKHFIFALLPLLLVAFAGEEIQAQDGAHNDAAASYSCPMHEDVTASEPGSCSVCGMALIAGTERTRVGILVFDDMQILDFAGPYDVFATNSYEFEVFTVSERSGPVKATNNLTVNPSFTFDTCPTIDVLVIPGGNVRGPLQSTKTIDWIRETADDADHVLSVCTGAFLIAKAGLLEGQTATTYHTAIDQLRQRYPNTKVVNDQRYVDNGKVVVSAGISSGIDASLYLVGKLTGMGEAQGVALSLEYDWDPKSTYVRAQLADQILPAFHPSDDIEMRLLRSEGDRDSWEIESRITTKLPIVELVSNIHGDLSKDKNWIFDKPVVGTETTVIGHRSDANGKQWRATILLKSAADTNTYRMQVSLARG